jgi:hypothetical protein
MQAQRNRRRPCESSLSRIDPIGVGRGQDVEAGRPMERWGLRAPPEPDLPGVLDGGGDRHRHHRQPRAGSGVDVGDSEDEVFWRGFLRSLRSRGLSGVRLVISDQHAGLVAALRRVQGRLTSTLSRALREKPVGAGAQVASGHGGRRVPHDLRPARSRHRRINLGPGRDQLGERSPKIAVLMDDATAEILAFSASCAPTGPRCGRRTRSSD